MNNLEKISGLKFEERWRANIGGDAYVVPYATVRPVNLVYHGKFQPHIGYYGLHPDQDDCLTFLGGSDEIIRAIFTDRRVHSVTRGAEIEIMFAPGTQKVLHIPAGVEHIITGLKNVYTLNFYSTLSEKVEINARDGNKCVECCTSVKVPEFVAHSASTACKEKQDGINSHPIPGLGWQQHFHTSLEHETGMVPLIDPFPLYVVDHGVESYIQNHYEIHYGQENRLTFLGSQNQKIRLVLIDCRSFSPVKHQHFSMEFVPDPKQYLVIPNGVAHRFTHMESIFTINRPAILSDDWRNYNPANDVIEWPEYNQNFPSVYVSSRYVPQEFYSKKTVVKKNRIKSQREKFSNLVFMSGYENQHEAINVSMTRNASRHSMSV